MRLFLKLVFVPFPVIRCTRAQKLKHRKRNWPKSNSFVPFPVIPVILVYTCSRHENCQNQFVPSIACRVWWFKWWRNILHLIVSGVCGGLVWCGVVVVLFYTVCGGCCLWNSLEGIQNCFFFCFICRSFFSLRRKIKHQKEQGVASKTWCWT